MEITLIITATLIYVIGIAVIWYMPRRYPDSTFWSLFEGRIKPILWLGVVMLLIGIVVSAVVMAVYDEFFRKTPYDQLIDMGWKPGDPITVGEFDKPKAKTITE